MSTINQLSALNAITAADLFAVYSSSSGDARKVAASVLLAYIQSALEFPGFVTQYSAPLAAATVQITDGSDSIHMILTPAGVLATLTLKLPALANCVDGQEFLVNTTQALTALTLDGNGASIVGFTSPAALAQNGFLRFAFDSTLSTWYRVG
jgi:hypothetical protein